MIDLYTWPTPNGRKVSIALEEMDLEYRCHAVNLQEQEQFKPEFLAISPNNKIPALVDHDTGQSIMESGAILIYLADKCASFWGDGRYTTLQWLMWQMGGFGPMLGQAHHFNFYAQEKVDYAINRYSKEANRLYSVLDGQLEGREYVADDYSIADIAIFPWTRTYERQHVTIEDYPNVVRWRKTMFARPAVQRGMKVGAEWRQDLRSLCDEEWKKLFGA